MKKLWFITIMVLISATFIFLTMFLSCGDDDDDDNTENEDANDDMHDDANDDDVNDDSASPDDDTVSEYNLDLDVYPGDAKHYGILCGNDTIAVLDSDGWSSIDAEGYNFLRCYAFSRDTFYLASKNTVFRMRQGEMENLEFTGEINHNWIKSQPMIFYNDNLGYVGSYEYRNGTWTDLGFKFWDIHADNDGVVIDDTDHCLKHWDGTQLELLTCSSDHPLSEPADVSFTLLEVQYNGADDVWARLEGGASMDSDTMHFSHWDGESWENTIQVSESIDILDSSGNIWDVKEGEVGFAVTQVFASEEKAKSGLYQLGSGVWQWRPRVDVVSYHYDRAMTISAAGQNEAWIARYHYIDGEYEEDPPLYKEYYLDQYLSGEHYFWEMKDLGIDGIRDIDVRLDD